MPTLVAFQNIVAPKMRATAAFVFFFVTTMVGVGLGPAVIGFVSDLYANAVFTGGDFSQLCPGGQAAQGSIALQKACSTASFTGIRYALLSAAALAVWSSIHYYLASRAIAEESSG